jgi:hypothetical protein
MGRESGGDHSLPLLPAGITLFENLPARAIVLDALAPAVGTGIIIMVDGERIGVLIIRDGTIDDAVTIDTGSRSNGNTALALMRGWEAAEVSAFRLAGDAMALLEPLTRGRSCYTDLHLEWTDWTRLIDDLRRRGGIYIVELSTPAGRGVTVIRAGAQVATYTESHPMIGDPELLDTYASAGVGSVRVLVESETAGSRDGMAPITASGDPPVRTELDATHRQVNKPPLLPADHDGGNAALAAMFGSRFDSGLPSLVVLDREHPPAPSEVAPLLPALKLLVRDRLQRSSAPVEEIVQAAADDRQTVERLAERIRVMHVRGFMPATFEQLADDMLALSRRS